MAAFRPVTSPLRAPKKQTQSAYGVLDRADMTGIFKWGEEDVAITPRFRNTNFKKPTIREPPSRSPTLFFF